MPSPGGALKKPQMTEALPPSAHGGQGHERQEQFPVTSSGFPPAPSRKAVIVQCCYREQDRDTALDTSCKEAEVLDDLLQKFDFDPRNVHVLTDLKIGREQATLHNVHAQLRWLVDRAQAGDVLVFAFFGRGVLMPDPDSESLIGMEDCLCLSEFDPDEKLGLDSTLEGRGDPNKVLRASDVHSYLSKLPPGVSVFFLSDASHSQTLVRNPKFYDPKEDAVGKLQRPKRSIEWNPTGSSGGLGGRTKLENEHPAGPDAFKYPSHPRLLKFQMHRKGWSCRAYPPLRTCALRANVPDAFVPLRGAQMREGVAAFHFCSCRPQDFSWGRAASSGGPGGFFVPSLIEAAEEGLQLKASGRSLSSFDIFRRTVELVRLRIQQTDPSTLPFIPPLPFLTFSSPPHECPFLESPLGGHLKDPPPLPPDPLLRVLTESSTGPPRNEAERAALSAVPGALFNLRDCLRRVPLVLLQLVCRLPRRQPAAAQRHRPGRGQTSPDGSANSKGYAEEDEGIEGVHLTLEEKRKEGIHRREEEEGGGEKQPGVEVGIEGLMNVVAECLLPPLDDLFPPSIFQLAEKAAGKPAWTLEVKVEEDERKKQEQDERVAERTIELPLLSHKLPGSFSDGKKSFTKAVRPQTVSSLSPASGASSLPPHVLPAPRFFTGNPNNKQGLPIFPSSLCPQENKDHKVSDDPHSLVLEPSSCPGGFRSSLGVSCRLRLTASLSGSLHLQILQLGILGETRTRKHTRPGDLYGFFGQDSVGKRVRSFWVQVCLLQPRSFDECLSRGEAPLCSGPRTRSLMSTDAAEVYMEGLRDSRVCAEMHALREWAEGERRLQREERKVREETRWKEKMRVADDFERQFRKLEMKAVKAIERSQAGQAAPVNLPREMSKFQVRFIPEIQTLLPLAFAEAAPLRTLFVGPSGPLFAPIFEHTPSNLHSAIMLPSCEALAKRQATVLLSLERVHRSVNEANRRIRDRQLNIFSQYRLAKALRVGPLKSQCDAYIQTDERAFPFGSRHSVCVPPCLRVREYFLDPRRQVCLPQPDWPKHWNGPPAFAFPYGRRLLAEKSQDLSYREAAAGVALAGLRGDACPSVSVSSPEYQYACLEGLQRSVLPCRRTEEALPRDELDRRAEWLAGAGEPAWHRSDCLDGCGWTGKRRERPVLGELSSSTVPPVQHLGEMDEEDEILLKAAAAVVETHWKAESSQTHKKGRGELFYTLFSKSPDNMSVQKM